MLQDQQWCLAQLRPGERVRLGWMFISQIIPNHVLASGQSSGTGVHWVFAALITLFTLFFMDLLGDNPAPLFGFFAFMMVLQLVYVLCMMPETKGKTLEELEDELSISLEARLQIR